MSVRYLSCVHPSETLYWVTVGVHVHTYSDIEHTATVRVPVH